MQRWHGRIGDATAGDAALHRYRVRLHATPLDEHDAAAVQARLGAPEWALERVTAVVACGFWPGEGQLWTPDPRARISALATSPASRDGMPPPRLLAVETTLTRDALAKRLQQAFARERLVGIEVDDAFDARS